jgi:hypothetical protein
VFIYKLLTFLNKELLVVVSSSKALLDNLETVWILLNALVSFETELPTFEKSILFKTLFVSEGDKSKWAGVVTWPVLFFDW